MNIEDLLGLIQERDLSEYSDIHLIDEQLLCEIDSKWISKYQGNTHNWVLRKQLIKNLSQLILGDTRILSLVGISGIGKSSLALHLGSISPLSEIFPTLKIISFDTSKPNFDLFARQILGTQTVINEKPPQPVLINKMLDKLEITPCLLILDAVETIIDTDRLGNSQFWEPRFGDFFQKVLTLPQMRSRIIITSQVGLPSVLTPLPGMHKLSHTEYIKGLEIDEALLIFDQHQINPKNAVEQLYLQRIIYEYNGHPLALRVIAGEIVEPPYNGNITTYWQDCQPSYRAPIPISPSDREANSMEDLPILEPPQINLVERVRCLIEQSFERLLKYSTLAALLLCMGAAYRYSTERSAWLFFISDYPTSIQTSTFQILQQRLFIEESHVEHKVLYRLHRMIREVAIDKMSTIIEAEMFDLLD